MFRIRNVACLLEAVGTSRSSASVFLGFPLKVFMFLCVLQRFCTFSLKESAEAFASFAVCFDERLACCSI